VRRSVPGLVLALLLAACATPEREPQGPRLTASEGRARVASVLPKALADRNGWATDIYAAIATLGLDPSLETICAIVAVNEQESGFKADPTVANLPAIAWKEIERQREKLGIPSLVLKGALAISSSDGRSYSDRIDAVKTEHELSDIFEEIIDRVPLGRRLLAERNPVRTGGPMQVSVAYAQAHAKEKSYPYPVAKTIREEVFTRRGGLYFGVAHLLDYPAPYDAMIYRFADFNAGHYASRNAALQKALTELSGLPLELDGDLVTRETKDGAIGSTERAARTLASRLEMSPEQIRRDLELEGKPGLERSRLYTRVFRMADAAAGKPLPRAVLPEIKLTSPKFTRNLTTEWFARRVQERYRACLARAN
jgi:hypothetical protein